MKVNLQDGTTTEVDPAKVINTPQEHIKRFSNEDETIRHLTKENLDRAEFTNDDRTVIMCYFRNPERKDLKEGQLDSFCVNLEDKTSDGETHPYIKRIFEITTLDEIHEWTYKRIKQNQKMFREFAIKTAKDQGLVIDPIAYYDNDTGTSKIDTKFFGQTLALMFNDFDEEKSKEDLFIIKLAAFELDLVKNSDNREIKSKLRKAKTPIEILNILLELKSSTV